jgi:hypothetical protein
MVSHNLVVVVVVVVVVVAGSRKRPAFEKTARFFHHSTVDC